MAYDQELADAIAELARLRRLLEGLTPERIHKLIWPYTSTSWKSLRPENRQFYVKVAARIREYLTASTSLREGVSPNEV